MKIIKNVFFISLLCISTFSYSQSDGSMFFDNVRFGGTFNLGFGNNYTSIGVSPSAIYDFSEVVSAGVSFNYLYSKGKYYSPTLNRDFDVSSNIIGGSAIGLFNVLPPVQLSVELEQMHVNNSDDRFVQDNNFWNTALYFGLAYNTGNISFGMRYDVLYSDNQAIYGSAFTPVFRAYF